MKKNSVRRAEMSDLVQLSRLFNQHRMFNLKSSNLRAVENFIFQRLNQQDSFIFVYENEQNILNGFIQLYPILSSVSMQQALILNDLYVDESFRNKGVATELMQGIINFARTEQFAWMELETGIQNSKAQAQYRKMGMKQLNEIYRFNIHFSDT